MRFRQVWETGGMLLVLILLFTICASFIPAFASTQNLLNILQSVATIGLLSCTMMLCLAGGDFDLSIGSTVALSGVLAALLLNKFDNLPLALAVGIGVGALVGFINGFVIAKLGINALITTLATMQIVRGVTYIASNNTSVPISDEGYLAIGSGNNAVWAMIFSVVIFAFILNKTVFGRNILATGGNADAAKLAGVSVSSTKIKIFVLQGVMAAIAGIFLSSRISLSQHTMGTGLELQVISACVLGGVSLTGGIASITGVAAGVLIMGTAENAMTMMNIDPSWQHVVRGTILLIAVLLDRLKTRAARS